MNRTAGDEGVEQARVVALARDPAKLVVHGIRITLQQIGGHRDPQLAKISADGRADVGDVFETSNILPTA